MKEIFCATVQVEAKPKLVPPAEYPVPLASLVVM